MTSADLPDHGTLVDDGGATEPEPLLPTVVAVVVTRNPGPWLEQTLRSLGEQDYPALRVLVVDAASAADPSARVTATLSGAAVRRVPEIGFAAAANEALDELDGATFLMLCHDDVVLDPSAVRLLLEEAYRSNAAIVGPKIVDADNPEVLLEVGRSIDRFGDPHTGIEPGEIDQEQHDGVRDVFYVSSAAMLVRTDLFQELSGFDPGAFPGAEDLDLCWRARLAGARVMVAPDARVRHREAAGDRAAGDAPEPVAIARSRIRAVLVSSSFATLLWLVPVGFVTALLEAVYVTLTLGRARSRATFGAWWWNLRHLGEIRRARRRAQSLRRVSDRDLRELRVHAGRLRGFASHYLTREERLRSLGDAGRSAVSTATSRARQPIAVAAAIGAAVFIVGSRSLLTGTVPAAGTLARWPGLSALFSSFASGWRYTGLGSTAPAPPALALMGALSGIFLGADGLARTVLVLGAFPIGALGAYHVARPMLGSSTAAAVAGFAYVITPVPRNALAAGRFGPLVLFALAPFLLSGLLRIARAFPDAVPPRTGRALLRLAVLTAVATAFFPLAPLALAALAIAIVLAAPLVGGLRTGVRMLGVAVAATIGAVVLLFPWPLAYAGTSDATALGWAFRPRLGLSQILRFQSGPAGAGWVGWGLLAAALVPIALASGTRLAWAVRGWVLAAVGWAVVFVPARFATDWSLPAPEAGLTLAALGVAIAVGVGVATIVDDVRRFRFGWRQLAVAAAAAGLFFPALGFALDAVGGRWHAPDDDWARALAFLTTERDVGGFRVLWLGDPAVLPLDPAVGARGVGYVLTRDGPGDARELWRAPERRADRLVGTAIALTEDGRTTRLGHLLAPMGVRYVAVPSRSGPGSDVNAPPGRALATALGDQLDLARLESRPGLVLYENTAWIPTRAIVRKRDARAVPLRSRDSTQAALRADVRASSVKGALTDSARAGPGTVLWSETFDDRWKATSGGDRLRHVEPFGWANGYVVHDRGQISIRFDGQPVRYGVIAIEALIWLGAVALAVRTRRRPTGAMATIRGRARR